MLRKLCRNDTAFFIYFLFVSVINPYAMKKYAKDNGIRGAKTDKLDSISIANYGIDKWYKL
jgi:transposase